jgi:TolB-like protein/tetratricopeptide (TPR) repeat protein
VGRSVADRRPGVLRRLRDRGVLRVAASYAVIAWLLLQIADVTFEPLGVPRWVMISLIATAVLGFPAAIALAWHFELGDRGLTRDTAADAAARPVVHGLRRYADVAIIGVLLATVAALVVRQSDFAKPPPPDRPTIAVLPFANLSGDPAQEYFSDGLAQELIDRLGRVPGLAVIGRSSAFSFKGKALDPRTIAERLGATTVLDGALRREGQRLKVSATLVDGPSGRTIWSETFDRKLTDVFAVQEELAATVIDAIVPAARGTATNAEFAPPTHDIAAYDLYLLGRAAQEARTGERLRESVGYFQRALQLDPDYAKAYAGLSRSLVLWQGYSHVSSPPDAQKRAEAAAYRALATDPELSEAHAALGTALRDRDPARAEDSYKRALELNPNNIVALYDYNVLLSRDESRSAEQKVLFAKVRELDPRLAVVWLNVIGQLLDSGQTARFRTEYARALTTLADDPDALNLVGMSVLVQGLPTDTYHAALAIEQAGNLNLALQATIFPLIMVEDYVRARTLAELARRRGGASERTLYYLLHLAAASGDWVAVDAIARDIDALGLVNASNLGPVAFWLSMQGRYAEAAAVYARIDPLPEYPGVPAMGAALLGATQGLPALLRTYRATGRADEADKVAAQYLASLRQVRTEPNAFGAHDALDLAALAANEGRQDEAVTALRRVLKHSHLIVPFDPQLPWFRSLEGHPGYAEVLAERQRRIDQARTEMRALEARFPDSVIVRTLGSVQPPQA